MTFNFGVEVTYSVWLMTESGFVQSYDVAPRAIAELRAYLNRSLALFREQGEDAAVLVFKFDERTRAFVAGYVLFNEAEERISPKLRKAVARQVRRYEPRFRPSAGRGTKRWVFGSRRALPRSARRLRS